MDNKHMDRAARRRAMRESHKPEYARQRGYLEAYPNDANPKDRIGTGYRPHWILKHDMNAVWKNGVGNTEFHNRADRRRLGWGR
jgi:hypothetical protein